MRWTATGTKMTVMGACLTRSLLRYRVNWSFLQNIACQKCTVSGSSSPHSSVPVPPLGAPRPSVPAPPLGAPHPTGPAPPLGVPQPSVPAPPLGVPRPSVPACGMVCQEGSEASVIKGTLFCVLKVKHSRNKRRS